MSDHVLFSADQLGPIQSRLADADAVGRGQFDLMQGVASGDQNLFRSTAAIGAGAAKIPLFDKGNFLARGVRHGGYAKSGVTAADDDDVMELGIIVAFRVIIWDAGTRKYPGTGFNFSRQRVQGNLSFPPRSRRHILQARNGQYLTDGIPHF